MRRAVLCSIFTSLLIPLQGRMTSGFQQNTAVAPSSTPSSGSSFSSSTEQLIHLLRKEEAVFTQDGKKRRKTCRAVDTKGSIAPPETGKASRRLLEEEADENGPSVQLYPIRLLVPALVLDSQEHSNLTQKLKNLVKRSCGQIGPLGPFGGVKILLPSETENKQIAEIIDTIKEEGLEPEPDFSVELAGKVIPDDPLFSDLWAFEEVKLTTAWELESTRELKRDARPIVCVSDSGVDYTHEDLYENIYINEAESLGVPQVDDDNNGYVDDIYGINVFDHSQVNNPMDASTHGTHVSGTLGAIGNNAKGVCGAAWRPRIIPCKFIGETPPLHCAFSAVDGSGMDVGAFILQGAISGAVECISYCVSRGAKVSAHSYSFSTYSETLQVVMVWAETQGLLMVFAAGNSGADVETKPSYPACYAPKLTGALAVANLQRAGGSGALILNPRSNYGSCIHFGCPGTSIVSTLNSHQGMPYGSMNGSSMAAALMAGVVTLMVAVKPDLSPPECRRFVQRCIIRLPSLRRTVEWQGMPDARCCVYEAMNGSASRRVPWWSTFAVAGVGVAVALLVGDF